jgi:hypothetical protein
MCHQVNGVRTFCVEGCGQRRGSNVPRLPAVPEGKYSQAACGSSAHHPCASTWADAFIANWVARFGMPTTVTTDRGAQLTSTLWTATCTSLGIKHILTTSYYPQSNGMVERMHRQLKDALCARGAGPAWHSHLAWVLMGLHAAPKKDSAVS